MEMMSVPAIIASFGRTKASGDAFAAYSGACLYHLQLY